MKQILFIILVTLSFFGCSSSDNSQTPEIPEVPKIPENPKEYIVSLGFYGEITNIEESPLLRATSNDLYGIQVYSMPVNGSEYKPYAYGLFDDKTNMTIKLLEGYKYKFESTMVVDGKNRIRKISSGYSSPFHGSSPTPINPIISSQFIYSISTQMDELHYGITFLDAENKIFDRPNIDRYYGVITEYEPSNNSKVSINMKRVVFGAKFTTEGLSEGILTIDLKGSPKMNIIAPSAEVQDIFTLYNMNTNPTDWTADDYTETIPVSVSWEKLDGAIIPLVNQDITFKRNKLTTITVKVKDSSVNNGVDISQDNTPMGDGGNITIEAGNNTGTDVDPSI